MIFRSGATIASLALLAAACSPGTAAVEAPTTTSTMVSTSAATTTQFSPSTSTLPAFEVRLALHDRERLALRGGVTLEVLVGDVLVGELSDESPSLDLQLADSAGIEFRYRSPDGASTEVAWSQQASRGDAEVVVMQPWREPDGAAVDIVLAWQRDRATLDEASAEVEGLPLTVVSPLWWNINGEGLLTGEPDPDYVAAMHGRGLQVWPAVQGLHADGLHILLNDSERRQRVVTELSEGSRLAGADGFNIDLEGFRDEDAAAFSVFVEELAAAVHGWGGIVSYDLVPRSDRWDVTPPELAFWSTAPQRRRLAAAVDYTVLMAYDQHNRYRPAGPVAAPAWVEEMIVYQLRYADPHTIVLGLPAYGRLWDPEELDAPRALGVAALRELEGERSPDPEFGVDRVELPDGRFYWVDHEVTSQRVALGEAYGLSGVAVWRLGLDDAAFWDPID